jgi:hypothetical protein
MSKVPCKCIYAAGSEKRGDKWKKVCGSCWKLSLKIKIYVGGGAHHTIFAKGPLVPSYTTDFKCSIEWDRKLKINTEEGNDMEGSGVAHFKVPYRHLLEGTEKNHRKLRQSTQPGWQSNRIQVSDDDWLERMQNKTSNRGFGLPAENHKKVTTASIWVENRTRHIRHKPKLPTTNFNVQS